MLMKIVAVLFLLLFLTLLSYSMGRRSACRSKMSLLPLGPLGHAVPVAFAREDRVISGVVSDLWGAPLQGVKVWCYEEGSTSAVTDSDGRYALICRQAPATLVFVKTGFQYMAIPIEVMMVAEDDREGITVDVSLPGDHEEV